jgi:hypothetical protein
MELGVHLLFLGSLVEEGRSSCPLGAKVAARLLAVRLANWAGTQARLSPH